MAPIPLLQLFKWPVKPVVPPTLEELFSTTQLGDDYALKMSKGWARTWNFSLSNSKMPQEHLDAIHAFLKANREFLWTQPGEFAVEGQQRAKGGISQERFFNRELSGLECAFKVSFLHKPKDIVPGNDI